MSAPAPKALLFDVFGTLTDWRGGVARAVAAAFAARGAAVDAHAFADAWRGEYQPAMERVRSGARPYAQLDELHRENLDRTLARMGFEGLFDEDERDALARAWERLPPWPDAPGALERLRAIALTAACSNGSVGLMARLARHAGLRWDCILGADLARDYKPRAGVYLAACAALRLRPEETAMVACHDHDLAAARAAGLRAAWIARPLEHGPGRPAPEPEQEWDWIARDLHDLADQLGAPRP
ncbi:haloacid dehalogenase type II [Oceanicella actignis]|uniref:(S)-2-haloacid dehalogenase n=1 Tax=Oceanicella actignis TaxID=1189325 RepID=A0A1M7T9P4_9RHOB|nr:haloacid dehalogenase type II [Oceanicella actignis]SET51274.1 2-haloacid dehalogenase [Oceanicella actignis]SHN67432.1 2-haloacid dehalogenase [Oceanicella actignis]